MAGSCLPPLHRAHCPTRALPRHCTRHLSLPLTHTMGTIPSTPFPSGEHLHTHFCTFSWRIYRLRGLFPSTPWEGLSLEVC